MADVLETNSVRRVREALADLGAAGQVVQLAETARSAEEAAKALGVEPGAIVKSLVFVIGDRPVMALIAGDRQCDANKLAVCLGLKGKAKRADADTVRAATGYAIGGVAPVGHATALPVVIDASLGRFDQVYAAAGHPHCVFPTTLAELARITPGVIAEDVAKRP